LLYRDFISTESTVINLRIFSLRKKEVFPLCGNAHAVEKDTETLATESVLCPDILKYSVKFLFFIEKIKSKRWTEELYSLYMEEVDFHCFTVHFYSQCVMVPIMHLFLIKH
jgi:hypothetical protein